MRSSFSNLSRPCERKGEKKREKEGEGIRERKARWSGKKRGDGAALITQVLSNRVHECIEV